jgi:hypothetical protein
VSLTNETAPDFKRLPESDRADMDAFIEQLRLVLPILGFDLFRSRASSTSERSQPATADDPLFVFSTTGASAQAREKDDGFVVLAGSTARRTASETFQAGYRALRERLLADGSLVEGLTDAYRFDKDVIFSNPSAAAAIIAGRSASGPLEWRVRQTGESYRDWRAAQLTPP